MADGLKEEVAHLLVQVAGVHQVVHHPRHQQLHHLQLLLILFANCCCCCFGCQSYGCCGLSCILNGCYQLVLLRSGSQQRLVGILQQHSAFDGRNSLLIVSVEVAPKTILDVRVGDHDGILVRQHLQPGHVHLAQIEVQGVEDLPREVRIGGVITEYNRGYIRCRGRMTLGRSLVVMWLVVMLLLLLLLVIQQHIGVGAG